MLMKASSLLEGDRVDLGGPIGLVTVGFVDVRGATTLVRTAHNRRTVEMPSNRTMRVIPPTSVVADWGQRFTC